MLVCEAHIARAKSVRISDELARRAVKLHKNSRWMEGQCLWCGGTDRFFVHVSENVFGCRQCGRKGDVIDLVMMADGVAFFDAVRLLTGDQGMPPPGVRLSTRDPTDAEGLDEGAAERTRLIARLWRESIAPGGTPVELYLRKRLGAVPPWLLSGRVLRYHPHMLFGGLSPGPCVVGLYRQVGVLETKYGPASANGSVALHRTMITPNGDPVWVEVNGKRKKAKKAIGPTRNAAIKLVPDVMGVDWAGPEITYALGVAEGIETAAGAWLLTGIPTWAVGYAANMAEFPLLPGLETLVLFVDHDEAGQKAGAAAWNRWVAAEREVIWKIPNELGTDFADLVRP